MEHVVPILIGLGLAASCGLRVFVPLLVLAAAARFGGVQLSPAMSILSTDGALLALSVASLIEVAAYWIPWVDHALDVVAAPLAVGAGTLVAGSQWIAPGSEQDLLKWGAALVGGGGVAGAVKAGSVALRGLSTVSTAGVANPVVSTVESATSLLASIMAIVVPVVLALLGLVALACVVMLAVVVIRRRRRRKGVEALTAASAGAYSPIALSSSRRIAANS
ncbi:MAG: DUF4126 domain-containing protein [Phycisphaerales bacterium]|nr:DUF4126 domain-containing protein [Phycisphaerales bacterium]